jgi:holo-[acyl-carrier protein] synthase
VIPVGGNLAGGNVVGVGIDAVDVARYRRVLERTPGIAPRTFTPGELAYARLVADPTQRLAARFAAKEATMKAFGVGLGACGFHDIEVVRADGGEPSLVLHGAALDLLAARGATRVLLSMTHTDLIAQAIVVAVSS